MEEEIRQSLNRMSSFFDRFPIFQGYNTFFETLGVEMKPFGTCL